MPRPRGRGLQEGSEHTALERGAQRGRPQLTVRVRPMKFHSTQNAHDAASCRAATPHWPCARTPWWFRDTAPRAVTTEVLRPGAWVRGLPG